MKPVLISLASILGLIMMLVVGIYLAKTLGLKTLDAEARQLAPGQFIELSQGQTHYQFEGVANDKPLIVLVHGFSTPSFVWRGLTPLLTQAGYQVLHYDLYGRGWSDRPKLRYDADLFYRQLKELLAALKIKKPIVLVGYSMGGAIAAHFTARMPVAALALIAPAGLDVVSGDVRIFNVPLVGDWLMAVRGRQIMLETMAQPENQGKAIPDIVARYEAQMQYDGYLTALLSTIRHFPLGNMERAYQKIGAKKCPVLGIFGAKDEVIPISVAARLKRLIAHSQIAIHARASHAITYSESEFVAQKLIGFLRSIETPICSTEKN